VRTVAEPMSETQSAMALNTKPEMPDLMVNVEWLQSV